MQGQGHQHHSRGNGNLIGFAALLSESGYPGFEEVQDCLGCGKNVASRPPPSFLRKWNVKAFVALLSESGYAGFEDVQDYWVAAKCRVKATTIILAEMGI
jgi:hypothetical protein